MRLVQMVAPQALGSFYLGLYDFSKFEGQKKRVAYRVLHMNLQFMFRKSLFVQLCLAPKMATG